MSFTPLIEGVRRSTTERFTSGSLQGRVRIIEDRDYVAAVTRELSDLHYANEQVWEGWAREEGGGRVDEDEIAIVVFKKWCACVRICSVRGHVLQ